MTPCKMRASHAGMISRQHELSVNSVPESDALSPSAPRKGTSSAPISRRKLLQAQTPASLAKKQLSQLANQSCGSSPQTPRSDSGRPWRERLASMKALLGVGTDGARLEVCHVTRGVSNASQNFPPALTYLLRACRR